MKLTFMDSNGKKVKIPNNIESIITALSNKIEENIKSSTSEWIKENDKVLYEMMKNEIFVTNLASYSRESKNPKTITPDECAKLVAEYLYSIISNVNFNVFIKYLRSLDNKKITLEQLRDYSNTLEIVIKEYE